jgi:hypothetical protein
LFAPLPAGVEGRIGFGLAIDDELIADRVAGLYLGFQAAYYAR